MNGHFRILVKMARLIWNRCPKHRMEMTRDYDKELRPFYYCPICGFYRYHEGKEGYDNRLIWSDIGNLDLINSEKSDATGPLCPQCKGNYLSPFEGEGWYCSRCKFRN